VVPCFNAFESGRANLCSSSRSLQSGWHFKFHSRSRGQANSKPRLNFCTSAQAARKVVLWPCWPATAPGIAAKYARARRTVVSDSSMTNDFTTRRVRSRVQPIFATGSSVMAVGQDRASDTRRVRCAMAEHFQAVLGANVDFHSLIFTAVADDDALAGAIAQMPAAACDRIDASSRRSAPERFRLLRIVAIEDHEPVVIRAMFARVLKPLAIVGFVGRFGLIALSTSRPGVFVPARHGMQRKPFFRSGQGCLQCVTDAFSIFGFGNC